MENLAGMLPSVLQHFGWGSWTVFVGSHVSVDALSSDLFVQNEYICSCDYRQILSLSCSFQSIIGIGVGAGPYVLAKFAVSELHKHITYVHIQSLNEETLWPEQADLTLTSTHPHEPIAITLPKTHCSIPILCPFL